MHGFVSFAWEAAGIFFQHLTQQQKKWIADCKLENNSLIDWKMAYIRSTIQFKCTTATKLIVFQFKPLNRQLASHFLKKIVLKGADLCTFCNSCSFS